MQFDCDCGLATAYEDTPECPECGKRMKHLRLEVLEREHSEFFERWHGERRKREHLANDIERCYRMLLSEPDTKGALFKAENILREALAEQKVGDGGTAPEGHNDRVEGRDAASSRRVPSHDGLCGNGDEGKEHEL